MRYKSFSELSQSEFYVRYLAASDTLERPMRTFRCTKNIRRFDRLYYVRAGVFEITQDGGETIAVHAGEMLYLPNDCEYSGIWTSEEISYTSAEFILSDADGEFSLSDRIFIALRDRGGVVGDMMTRLFAVWAKGEIGYRIKTGALFLELLHHVTLENVKADLGRSYSDISTAIFYLENNYIEDVTAADLAKLCGMCESRFRSRFLAYAGMPPIRYRNYLRIKKAAELLASGEYTVTEAAELVGIPDVAYFNRVFKQFIGKNPGEVRGMR